MLSNITEAFFKVDQNGLFTYVDIHSGDKPYLSHEYLIGTSIWDAFPECRGSVFEKEYDIAMMQRVVRSIEALYEPCAGVWIEGRAYPVEKGGLAIYLRDITKRKMAENAWKQANHRKDEFLAVLAHELRNHLAPMSNASYLLNAGSVAEDVRKNSSSLVARQVKQMVQMVDDLMDVARISRGKIELRKENIKLSDALDSAIDIVRPLMMQAGHDLVIKPAPGPLHIHADSLRIVQIFSNLLSNAVKYTPQGGCITVAVELCGDCVLIRVKDTGIGIPEDKLATVFDMFSQVENTLDRSQGGLGIGLALAKNLVTLHEGYIEVRSGGVDQGSEFLVSLPLVKEMERPESISEKSSFVSKKIHSVLVVDDNKETARTLGWTVETLGHSAHLAFSGRQAIEAAKSFRPDIVLMDLSLPDMNGHEVFRILKQNPALKDTLFVAQTGWGQKENRDQALKIGFDHYLVKPFKISELEKIFEGTKGVSVSIENPELMLLQTGDRF